MFNRDSPLAQLMAQQPHTGRVTWIGLRPARNAAMQSVDSAVAVANRGLSGDRSAVHSGGKRQVTLVQAEHLAALAAFCRRSVAPQDLRRNLAIAEINILSLRERHFRIGDALLFGTGACHPCSRMEQTLGRGGYNAMRGHGGITAIVVRGGVIGIGDPVTVVSIEEAAAIVATDEREK